jgi:hypothetical protein
MTTDISIRREYQEFTYLEVVPSIKGVTYEEMYSRRLSCIGKKEHLVLDLSFTKKYQCL